MIERGLIMISRSAIILVSCITFCHIVNAEGIQERITAIREKIAFMRSNTNATPLDLLTAASYTIQLNRCETRLRGEGTISQQFFHKQYDPILEINTLYYLLVESQK